MLSKGLIQAYQIQDAAHALAMRIQEQLKQVDQVDRDSIAMFGIAEKAWSDAQERIRIHRGKPLPGSLTHEKRGVKRKSAGPLLAMPAPAPDETQAGDAS